MSKKDQLKSSASSMIVAGVLLGTIQKDPKADKQDNSASLTEKFSQEQKQTSPDGIYRLAGLLKKIMGFTAGPYIKFMDCEYEYDDEERCHVFEISAAKYLPGQKKMSPAQRAATRDRVRSEIHTFLEDLDLFLEPTKGEIFPKYGQIVIDSKTELLNLLTRYLTAANISVPDIHDISLNNIKVPKSFKKSGVREFNLSQSYREVSSVLGKSIDDAIAADPKFREELLERVFIKPFQDYEAYRSYAAASLHHVDESHYNLGMAVALTVAQIQLEDGLDDTRDIDLNLLHAPLKLSIN